MKKRATALLLILLMIVSLMPALGSGALAAGEVARYVETTGFEDGKEYIIAVDKDSSSAYALKNVATGTSSTDTGSVTLTVVAASGSNAAYIETDDTGVAWTYRSSDQNLLNGEFRLSYNYQNSNVPRASSSNGYAVTFSDGNLKINNRNLTCNDGTFGTSSSSKATVRLFVKTDGTEPATVAVTGVSLDKTSLEINEGATGTLTATIAPADATNKAVTWSSSDTSIATVSNGTVTGVKAGSATITVTTVDGGKTATCAVTVKETEPGEVVRYVETTGFEDGKEYIIAVDKDSSSAYVVKNVGGTESGNTGSVELTVIPASGPDQAYIETNDALVPWTYTSSNQYLANSSRFLSYESGTYLPRASGNGRAITYTNGNLRIGSSRYLTCDNGTFNTGTTGATVRLFVKTDGTEPAPVAVTGVSLDKSSLEINEGATGTLVVTIAPADATNKAVTWTSSDTAIATVSNGIVTGIKAGSATITVTTVDGGKTATCAVTVKEAEPGEVARYVETTSFVLNGEYVIGAVKDDGSVYAIQKNGSSALVKSMEISVSTNDNDGKSYVVTSEATAVWKYGSDSFLHNGSDCLFPTSSNGVTAYPDTQSNLRVITFTNDHKLSFVSGGGTTYYITCSNGTFDTSTTEANAATFRLFVKTEEEPGPVSVTGVTLDKATMALTVSGTGTLTATVAPENAANKNVTWSSSDTDVATVDNSGVVTAVAAGTATITVTTEDGNKTATCDVTVTAPQEIEYSVIELAKLKNSSVWLIQVEEEEGKGFTYKGDALVWSSRYAAYVIAVEGGTKPEPVAADFATADAAAPVDYPAANDANGSKKVDMADVQYIYNLYSGKYETLEAAGDMTKVLGADINGDGVIDSTDATPILTALRGAQA